MKKPLVLYRAVSRDPSILGIQSQGLLNQVPTLAPSNFTEAPAVFSFGRHLHAIVH